MSSSIGCRHPYCYCCCPRSATAAQHVVMPISLGANAPLIPRLFYFILFKTLCAYICNSITAVMLVRLTPFICVTSFSMFVLSCACRLCKKRIYDDDDGGDGDGDDDDDDDDDENNSRHKHTNIHESNTPRPNGTNRC